MRYQFPIGVFTFLEREDGKILLLRRLHPWKQGMCDAPSGHVERDETFLQAACREVNEEAGVTVDPSDMELIHAMEYPKGEYFYVFFRAKRWTGEPEIMEPKSHSELIWASPEAWPDPVDYTQAAWQSAKQGLRWSVWEE